MVQWATSGIMSRYILIAVLAAPISTARADIWGDIAGVGKQAVHGIEDTGKKAVKGVKNVGDKAVHETQKAGEAAGREIKKAGETAGKAIADRFKDTKLTRAADYAARKAAFEAALAGATGVLKAAQLAAQGTLITAEQTAQGSLTAGEKFLSDVVGKASPAILQASAQSTKDILQGAQIGAIATLQGTRWVVDHTITQLTINHVRYEGDLKDLEKGIFGEVSCEGSFLGKKFSIKITLDPRDLGSIKKSIEPILDEIKDIFTNRVHKPVDKANAQIDKTVAALPPALTEPVAVHNLDDVDQQVQAAMAQIAQAEQAAAKVAPVPVSHPTVATTKPSSGPPTAIAAKLNDKMKQLSAAVEQAVPPK